MMEYVSGLLLQYCVELFSRFISYTNSLKVIRKKMKNISYKSLFPEATSYLELEN